MKRCLSLVVRVVLVVLGGGFLVSGCATPTMQPMYVESRLPQPAMFSDETDRAIVRQTRELLDLKRQDYRVGPDDVLAISVFEWEMSHETKTLEFRVEESGVISMPVLGAVPVVGLTVQQIQDTVIRLLAESDIIQNPRVAVSVKEFRSLRISVIGAVHQPGVYAIHQNVTTLLDILPLAGGPTANAGTIAYVIRPGLEDARTVRITVNLEDAFKAGREDANPVLRGGDVVYVPAAPLVYVYGNVRSAGAFQMRRTMRVLEAVALAGGLASRARKDACTLIRQTGTDEQQMFPVNLARIQQGLEPNFYLHPDDVLYVPESAGKVALQEAWSVFRGIFTFTYRLDKN